MIYQHCNTNCHKHGKDRQGYQRWKCSVCNQTFSENPNPSKPGPKPLNGQQAMTGAERVRRFRQGETKKRG